MAQTSRATRVALLGALLGLSLLGTGCLGHRGAMLTTPDLPRELSMVTHPPHIIEPGDTLIMTLLSLPLPKPPYRIRILDELRIFVITKPPDAIEATGLAPEDIYIVEPEGVIRFPGTLGNIKVVNLTLDEAGKIIREQAMKPPVKLKDPVVLVTLHRGRELEPIPDTAVVRPDGTISLGGYGAIHVAGLSEQQARVAIEEHLSEFLITPELSLEVSSTNYKSFYLVIERADGGHSVSRVPLAGKENVLDIMAAIEGVPVGANTHRIWVARPAPSDAGCDQVLVVNWADIVERGRTATNYQLLPGDRLFIKSDPWLKVDTFLAKVYAPFERTANFVTTIVNAEELTRAAFTIPGGIYSGGLFGFGFPGFGFGF